jgi:hypothetical protein
MTLSSNMATMSRRRNATVQEANRGPRGFTAGSAKCRGGWDKVGRPRTGPGAARPPARSAVPAQGGRQSQNRPIFAPGTGTSQSNRVVQVRALRSIGFRGGPISLWGWCGRRAVIAQRSVTSSAGVSQKGRHGSRSCRFVVPDRRVHRHGSSDRANVYCILRALWVLPRGSYVGCPRHSQSPGDRDGMSRGRVVARRLLSRAISSTD